jgi:glycerol kinase
MLGAPVVRCQSAETTTLGAAFAAGLATGFFPSLEALRDTWREEKRWLPQMPNADRDHLRAHWRKAVERSLGWVQ